MSTRSRGSRAGEMVTALSVFFSSAFAFPYTRLIGMSRVFVLKQLSSTNWEFERDHCKDILSEFTDKFDIELEVRDMPVGKNNKHKNSGKTLVAVFKTSLKNDLVAAMRWKIHGRYE